MQRIAGHIRRQAVGYLALFIAVGGTSYAAVSLPRNSVGSAQLRQGAVTAAKIKPRSLLAVDFKRGELRLGRGPVGPRGPQGIQGAKGDPGPKGDPGATHVAVRSFTDTAVANNALGAGAAACLPGEHVTGGGALFLGLGSHDDHLIASIPVQIVRDANGQPTGQTGVPNGAAGDGWVAEGINAGGTRDFVVYAICVAP